MPNNFGKKLIVAGASFGFLAVAVGAFGAHALEDFLSVGQKHTWETGVNYQFYHALGLLFLGSYLRKHDKAEWLKRAGWCWLIGTVFFSGSLYLLACRDMLKFPTGWIGPVTPIGGLLFLSGWAMVGWFFIKK